MDNSRPIPIPPPPPPPPPAEPMPKPGTAAWAAWHLRYTFKPDDAAIIQWLCTWKARHQRVVEYAQACHLRKWAGWQAVLAWSIVEHTCEPLDDDIPF